MPFPSNPSVGDTYVENNNTYKYLGPSNGWYRIQVNPSNDTTYVGTDGAPNGISGNTQVIFNDNANLSGDAGLTYNKTTDHLTAGAFNVTPAGSAPSIGVYSPGSNQVALATDGIGRLFINSTGQIGIGAASGGYSVDIQSGDVRIKRTAANDGAVYFGSTTGNYIYGNSAANLFAIATANEERIRIDSNGRVLIGTNTNSGGSLLQVNGNRIRISTAKTPASATDTGTTGEICWDDNYIYVCTATNTWKRTALTTW